MAIEGKKIFITGGAGFIGTAIIGRLIKDNHITIYDNLWRNALKDSPWQNHKNLHFIKGDVLDYNNLRESIQEQQIVIHLAAIAGIDTVIENHTTTMKVNMIGTYNVLEAALTLEKCERFLDFSTSEVFGTYAYKSEEQEPTTMGAVGEARWTYAVSKLAGEHLTYSYYKEFGLPALSIRPFNIYGPGQVGEGAIHIFIKQALKNDDIQIHGDGNQIRSWCYIDDIVDAVLLCLQKKEAVGNVFNIGNPRGTITILGLAETVMRVCNSKSKIVFVPRTYTDIELRIPSIKRAKELLGYKPKVNLEEGIRRTADWYRRFI